MPEDGRSMDIVSLLGISVGLAMDAFAVSVSSGATYRKATFGDALKTGAFFGIFQAVMPMIGWLAGTAFTQFITNVDHWIALILLGYLGGKMLFEALKKNREKADSPKTESTELPGYLGFRSLLTLAVATSIDALATGLLLPSAVGAGTLPLMLISVGTIGLITLLISVGGVYIGKKFGELFSSKAEIFGGIVLILIGVKIFAEHMFF